MAYTLQAIVIPSVTRGRAAEYGLSCVDLMAPGLSLIPLPFERIDELGVPFLPLTDGGEATLGPRLDALCRAMSADVTLAYVEAEFFGGDGIQGCVLYEDGTTLGLPMVDDEAINFALRSLGVQRDGERDEFDVSGFGMHRDTSDWLKDWWIFTTPTCRLRNGPRLARPV